ncbi:MAG: hypothetical protein EOO51_11370 [Flavobacterium sp.]|nr:MAG: hypothetical protein EOO51_11370 [Flavobacterium sp.]
MKNITLLAVVTLLFTAANTKAATPAPTENRFRNEEPVTFIERGIEFYVFPNGDFDFNTQPTLGQDIYYKRGNDHSYVPVGVTIEHDAYGRVRRIGNVFVNYDNANRIKRIGGVYMSYYRSMLMQVGGMRLIYNRSGQLIDTVGNINGYSQPAYTYQPQYQVYNGGYYGSSDNYYYKNGAAAPKKEEKEGIRK